MKNSPYPHQFYTPEDFSDRTFFDAFADAFTHPEDLTLHQPVYGNIARLHDANRIREYFKKALSAERTKKNNAPAG